MRTSWCGQVAAPKRSRGSPFPAGSAPAHHRPPMMNTTAGRPALRQPCSRPANDALLRLSPRSSRITVTARSGIDIGDGDRFLEHAPCRIAGAAFLDLDDVDGAEAGAATGIRRALAIALRKLALRALLQPADGGDHDPHAQRTHGPCAGSSRFEPPLSSSPAVHAAAPVPTSSRDCRRRGLPAGTHGR